ncbi:MAG: ABC transporter ATP-binding protein [Phycisphaerales bacterium]
MTISASSINFRYPAGPLILKSISCAIKPAAITAIIGPNGSGKSTLIRLLAGLRTPESGEINLNTHSIQTHPLHTISPKDRARHIAFIEQRPQLAFDFSVEKVVSFGNFSAPKPETHTQEAIERFELTALRQTPYGHLSVGQQQRVSLARAWTQIAQQPNGYLLADEPTSAMDPKHVLSSMKHLRALADLGIGVGIVMHDLNTTMRWADYVIILNQLGILAATGTADEVLEPQMLSQVFEVPIESHRLESGRSVLIVNEA